MSKVIKSQKCLDADPCQLQAVDVDAFFVDNDPAAELVLPGLLVEPDPAEIINVNSDPQAIADQALKFGEQTMANARQEADKILKEAKQERDKLLAKSREDAVKLKEQAQQEGLKLGKDQGIEIVRQEWETNLTTALKLCNEAEQQREERLKASEGELLKLALSIAAKIMGEELKLDPQAQLEIVKRALAKVSNAATIKIRVNPADLEMLTENLTELQEVFTEPKAISLEADQAIESGSCFINTEHGNVDARVKSQLERIMSELLKVGKI